LAKSYLSASRANNLTLLSINNTLFIDTNFIPVTGGHDMRQNTLTRVAESLVWLVIFFGIVLQTVAFPQVSQSLSVQYSEYAGDSVAIQIILSAIVLVGQIVLVMIWLLLSRIRLDSLFSTNTLAWVSALVWSLFVSATTFGILMVWLVNKNTLPPGIAILLLLAIITSSTVALVTLSLKSVLREAIANRIELDGVI
jgi:hypothetical protein